MNLELTKPIVFFDLESTGLDIVNDRIIQAALVRLTPDGEREALTQLINPGCPIPEESTDIHGITDADVADAPVFNEVGNELLDFIGDADLGGYNILRFDIPILLEEFARCGLWLDLDRRHVVDVYQVFRQKESHTLSRAVEFYCGREMTNAHDALADTNATIDVLAGQLEMYADLPQTVAAIDDAFRPERYQQNLDAEGKLQWDGQEVVIGFGGKRGRTLRELARTEQDYLRWILRKDFTATVKHIVEDALNGRFPTRPAE